MNNKILIIFFTILIVVGISGCTFKTEADETWGEKPPATIKDIYIYNSTGDHFEEDNITYYYTWGYVGNKAQLAAANVTITAKFYGENGTLIGTNQTKIYKPQKIPAEGKSYFYIGFKDPDQKIKSYKLEISIK